MRVKASAGLVLLVLVLAVGWSASPAYAHAALRSASPADGAVLARPPTAIVLTFNEKLQDGFTTIRVTSSGKRTQVAEAATDGDRVTQPLPAALPAGSYTTAYRVVSADGHPISGEVAFRLDPPPSSPQPTPSSAPAESPSAAAPSAAAVAGQAEQPATAGWIWLAGGLVVVAFVVGVLLVGRRRPSES